MVREIQGSDRWPKLSSVAIPKNQQEGLAT